MIAKKFARLFKVWSNEKLLVAIAISAVGGNKSHKGFRGNENFNRIITNNDNTRRTIANFGCCMRAKQKAVLNKIIEIILLGDGFMFS